MARHDPIQIKKMRDAAHEHLADRRRVDRALGVLAVLEPTRDVTPKE